MKKQDMYTTFVLIMTLSISVLAISASNSKATEDFLSNVNDCRCENVSSTYTFYTISKESLIDPSILQHPIEINNIYPFSNSLATDDLPIYFNWKDRDGKDFTTPAKHQSNCGSCWDFAAIGVLESVINIRENVSNLDPDLSEQYVLSCLPAAANNYAQGCNGGQPVNAYKCIMSTDSDGNNCNGVILESCFNYQANHNIDCSEKCDTWQGSLVPISDYGSFYNQGVLQNTEQSRNNIKNALIQHGPIATFMDVPDSFVQWGSIHHDPDDYCPYEERTFNNQLNHAIIIVGWKDDSSIPNGGYWICKNSWGESWGYDGFYNIEYGNHFTGYRVDWVDYNPDDFDWGFYYEKPNKPIIDGPNSGKSNIEQSYTAVTTDPAVLDICYLFNWGDGTDSGWLGPFESGRECEAIHSWMESGEYTVQVKAKNENGIESEWSDPLTVRMPKNQFLINRNIMDLFIKVKEILETQIEESYTTPRMYPVMIEPLVAPSSTINDNASVLINADLPNEFSWKNYEGHDWTTIAKDQGNCGSCWDFAAIGVLEAMVNIQKNNASINMDLSEQYVLSCLPAAANNYGQGCLGGNPYNAFRYLKDDGEEGNYCNGIISEECFSYHADHTVPCEEKCENWQDDLIPILDCGYSWPGIDLSQSEGLIKSKIYTYGPVAAGIDCTNDFITWGITHHDPDEYYPFIEQPWNNRLNHLIVIVGWKDDPNITNGGYWICKNSWGTEWGYDGFYNIEYGGMFSGAFISWVSIQTNEENLPPLTPDVPNGPSSGKINEECIYTTSTSDPEDQKISFRFDWGDGTISEWSELMESEEVFEITHTWTKKGEYCIRVMAKDELGAASEWSDPLEISMPKSYVSNIVNNYPWQMPILKRLF